jgi:hypothetical protein
MGKRQPPKDQLPLWESLPEEPQQAPALAHKPIPVAPTFGTQLSIEELATFSLATLKGPHDEARRAWMREWIETHDCPVGILMYSEVSGYYVSEFWPVSRERFLKVIEGPGWFHDYCLFIHCAGLPLKQYIEDAIKRGELSAPTNPDKGGW